MAAAAAAPAGRCGLSQRVPLPAWASRRRVGRGGMHKTASAVQAVAAPAVGSDCVLLPRAVPPAWLRALLERGRTGLAARRRPKQPIPPRRGLSSKAALSAEGCTATEQQLGTRPVPTGYATTRRRGVLRDGQRPSLGSLLAGSFRANRVVEAQTHRPTRLRARDCTVPIARRDPRDPCWS